MRVILIRNLSSINHFFIFVDFAWPIYDWFFLLLPFKFETALCKRFHYMISISWLGYRLTSRLAGHEWNCIAILLLLEAFFRSLNEDIRHISYIKTHFCNIFFEILRQGPFDVWESSHKSDQIWRVMSAWSKMRLNEKKEWAIH